MSEKFEPGSFPCVLAHDYNLVVRDLLEQRRITIHLSDLLKILGKNPDELLKDLRHKDLERTDRLINRFIE